MINYDFFNFFFVLLCYTQSMQPFGNMTIGTAGLVIIPLLVSLSTFGAANGSVFSGSRVTFVAAREGHLPEFLSGTHAKSKTPIPAILLQVLHPQYSIC